MVPIDPELGEEGHGEIDHLFGCGDNDRLTFEASEPVALAAMMAFDVLCCRFTLHELVLRDDITGLFLAAYHKRVRPLIRAAKGGWKHAPRPRRPTMDDVGIAVHNHHSPMGLFSGAC